MQASRLPQSESSDVILDVGGEASTILDRALYRGIDDILSGRIMEVISRDEETASEVRRWCEATCHELLNVEVHGVQTVFWIRKNGHEHV